MDIVVLENKEDAKAFIIDVFRDHDQLGYSASGAFSFESFVKDRTDHLTFFGLLEKNVLEGVLAYDEKQHHIALLFVKKDKQRQGFGKALVEFVAKKEEENHVSSISVHSADQAIGFYQKLGFEMEGEIEKAGDIRYCNMEWLLGNSSLGRMVTVVVEHTIGENHPLYPDTQYLCNYGYVDEVMKETGEFQNAYVYGAEEPVDSFRGIVIAVIYRKGEEETQWVVGRQGKTMDHEEIKKMVGFQEQFYETRFVFIDEQ